MKNQLTKLTLLSFIVLALIQCASDKDPNAERVLFADPVGSTTTTSNTQSTESNTPQCILAGQHPERASGQSSWFRAQLIGGSAPYRFERVSLQDGQGQVVLTSLKPYSNSFVFVQLQFSTSTTTSTSVNVEFTDNSGANFLCTTSITLNP